MNKHITDIKTGIRYTMQGDYYLPNLALHNVLSAGKTDGRTCGRN